MTIKEKVIYYEALEDIEMYITDRIKTTNAWKESEEQDLQQFTEEDSDEWRKDSCKERIENYNKKIEALEKVLESIRKM